ncbi:MAG: hypothetical protein ABI609_17680 [Acidobacteriota bacterium]
MIADFVRTFMETFSTCDPEETLALLAFRHGAEGVTCPFPDNDGVVVLILGQGYVHGWDIEGDADGGSLLLIDANSSGSHNRCTIPLAAILELRVVSKTAHPGRAPAAKGTKRPHGLRAV